MQLFWRMGLIAGALASMGAVHRTPNFVVNAPTPEIAEKVGKMAEHYRDTLAVEWLGHTLPQWYKPCQVTVKVGQIGSGGATSFSFDRGHVFGWNMRIQGSLERILDSVLPHEVSHTIFASHFRRPLPRWADEGAATLVEHESEKMRQDRLLNQVMRNNERYPLRKLLSMKEYPQGMRRVLVLYAQGYSLADFLVQRGGRAKYLEFLQAAHQRGWDAALKRSYGISGVDEFEKIWSSWVTAGSPPLNRPDGTQLAERDDEDSDVVVRGQSPEGEDDDLAAPIPVASRSRERSRGRSRERDERLGDWEAVPVSERRPRPSPLQPFQVPVRGAVPLRVVSGGGR